MKNIELKKFPFINANEQFGSFSLRASAIVRFNNKYVLVLNEGQKLYKHPGGHLNIDESLIDGLMREIKEEIGLDIIKYQGNDPFFDYVQINGNFMINAYFEIEIDETEYDAIVKNSPLPFKLFAKEDLNLSNTWESEIRAIEIVQSRNI